ncbi:MAG: LAGLIDADG family homing endonuclease [Candidatus Aenigmatarchaeota archaeon]
MNYKEAYKEALKLRDSGLTYSAIGKNLDISKDTVFGWLVCGKSPNRPRNQTLLPTSYNLTACLSYILGVMKGDGFIRHSKYTSTIVLASKDLDFCQTFKGKLEEWSGIKCTDIIMRKDGLFEVTLSSKEAGNLIETFNLSKILGESNNIKSMIIRGLCDSEGSVIVSGYTRSVKIYGTNKKLLIFAKTLMKSLGVDSRLYHTMPSKNHFGKKIVYCISVRRKENIKKFSEIIGFSIQRKQEKLNKLLSLYKR